MRKVTKPMARKLYNEGKVIYLVPCKCRVNENKNLNSSIQVTSYGLKSQDGAVSFETMLNRFEYYNCNNETGKYTHFYIEP